jgi:hypothetical protein
MIRRISLTMILLFTIVSAGVCASKYSRDYHSKFKWYLPEYAETWAVEDRWGGDESYSKGLSFSEYTMLKDEKIAYLKRNRDINERYGNHHGGTMWIPGTKKYLSWGSHTRDKTSEKWIEAAERDGIVRSWDNWEVSWLVN